MKQVTNQSFELFKREQKYWVRFLIFDKERKEFIKQERNTQVPSKPRYRHRAKKIADRIIQQNKSGQKIVRDILGDMVYTNLEVVSGSQMENNMKLIRIRKNKIYFDFYYLDPISGTKKRCQSSTGLKNTLENQVIAKQKALGHYHALSQLGKPKVEPPMVQKVFHSQPTQKIPDSFSSSNVQEQSFIETSSIKTFLDLFEDYKSDPQWMDTTKETKHLYTKYFNVHIQPFFTIIPVNKISIELLKSFRDSLSKKRKVRKDGSLENYTRKYLNQIFAFVKVLVSYAFEKEYLQRFSLMDRSLKKFKESKPQVNALTPDERDIFLSHIKNHDSYYYPVICFCCFYWSSKRRTTCFEMERSQSDITYSIGQIFDGQV